MIKLIQVITDTNIGGAGIWLLNFLSSYDRGKLDVSVALPENSMLEERVVKLGVPVHIVKNIADSSYSREGISEFIKLFKKEKPQVIHSHASLSARIAARRCGISIVNTRHCLEGRKSFPKSIVYRFINNALSDAVIAVSEAVADNLRRDGIKENKLHVVYNGVAPLSPMTDEEKQSKRRELGIPEENTVIGLVARLEAVKRHDVFLKAAAKLKDKPISFVIVGDGSLRDRLEKTAAELGISEKVVFTGYIGNMNEIADVLDVTVLSSESEALPISLIEAMTLSKPCVSTDCGGTKEIISDGKSGFIVPTEDCERLAEKLALLADSKELRQAFGNEGGRLAAEKFSVNTMCDTLLSIYTSLQGGKKRE